MSCILILAAACLPATADPTSTSTTVLVTTTVDTSTTTTTATSASTTTTLPALAVSATDLAESIEPVVSGCADAIAGGESDASQYPAADLSRSTSYLVQVAEFYGVIEAAACFGLFPGVFMIVLDSSESRLYLSVASAWLGCGLGWIDSVQYVYGANWLVDAPYWEGFPGTEVAELTGGTSNFRTCEAFMDSYADELGDDFVMDVRPVPVEVLRTLLGEQ